MSAPRVPARHLLAALAIAVAATAWLFAALRLWRTSVPGDLALPRVDPSDRFAAEMLAEATSYTRFLDVTSVLAAVALLVALGLYAWKGTAFVRESAAGRIGTGMLLGMLGLAFVWLSQLPFGAAQLWWMRRHGIAELGYLEWLVNDWFLVGGQFLFISFALVVVMALAAVWRRGWWLLAVPALAGLVVAFAFVQPYLLTDLEPLPDRQMAADARQLAAQQGISAPDVRVQETHGTTDAPNALAAGLGPSERVVLWDTLVEEFDRPEVRLVLAHEFAHLSRDHIWKTLGWWILLLLPVALLTALATRRRGGLYEPTSVPVAILVVALLFVLSAPFQNSFSQRLEAEADWIALQSTGDPDALDTLFEEFAELELIDPAPPAWSRLALDSHPSIMRRLEMAQAWRVRRDGGD